MRKPHWLERIETLQPRDPCDVWSDDDGRWYPGIVRRNGMALGWVVWVPVYTAKSRLFRALSSASRTLGAYDPPHRMMEAINALPDITRASGLAPEMRLTITAAIEMSNPGLNEWLGIRIESIRCRGQVDAWPDIIRPAVAREPFDDEVWEAIWGTTTTSPSTSPGRTGQPGKIRATTRRSAMKRT